RDSRVVLEKVLGITTSSSSGLACDPHTGSVAYPAGCVIVILNPKKNKQTHIFNTSRKTFSALAFSHNGKYLVTGESGHMPCVRVWDVAERTQVAEVQCHKYGVACVAFSTTGSYIVSVGYQHDRTVSVWEWKRGTVIASNKVSSRVLAVSFSEDSSYFVTAGNRHVKFWYLDASKERRVNSTVPLIGRSGLLGEHQNSEFCDLACGRGTMASSTYCITHTGLLCQFNSNRQLDLWVDLKTTSARCLSVSEAFIFCGCADGTVRVFSPQNLHYVTTLHRPHCLGVDVSQSIQTGHLFKSLPDAEYPDTLALTHDPVSGHLTCVYNDHSVYVWDVHDISNVGKVYSALYHSGCVWSVETYPELENSAATLLPGSFLTCSSDNTIRLWNSEFQQSRNQNSDLRHSLYSQDLVRIVYVDKDTGHLKALAERGEGSMDGKFGIRVLGISPDGQHLAAGDRSGNLRIFDLQFMDEVLKIEAHDSEVLCLAFSPAETGFQLLASASRDRLIHIFNMESNYSLVQTVYDHSASVTAMKFTGVGSKVCMVSCGADKSIYFRSAEKSSNSVAFSRSHHVVEKSTLYDMDLDATSTHTAIACQDRNIRVYNVKSGKMKKCFKGSATDDGTLLKVQLDPSGTFLATSCSDKSICIFDYESGECVATLFGHSEIVTGMKFSQDCRHLITVCGDSCVFVWRLCSQMTNSMKKRLAERKRRAGQRNMNRVTSKDQVIRRETYIAVPRVELAQTEEVDEDSSVEGNPQTPARMDTKSLDLMMLQSNGRLPMWARRLGAGVSSSSTNPTGPSVTQYQPQGRWALRADPLAVRSLLEKWSLQLPLSHTPSRAEEEDEYDCEEHEDVDFHPQSLDSLLGEEEEEGDVSEQFSSVLQETDLQLLSSSENNDYILYPANSTALSTAAGEFDVKGLCEAVETDQEEEELSADSACSAESDQVHSDQAHDRETIQKFQWKRYCTILLHFFCTFVMVWSDYCSFSSSVFLWNRCTYYYYFFFISICMQLSLPATCLVTLSFCHLQLFLLFTDMTEKAAVSQATVQNATGNPSIFEAKHTSLTSAKSVSFSMGTTKFSSLSDSAPIASSCAKRSFMDENLNVCPVNENHRGAEVLRNVSLSNQDLSVNLDCKENLPPPPRTCSSKGLSPMPEKPAPPPAPPALGNHSARAALHLDLSGPGCVSLPPASLKSLRSQVGHIDPLCRQALVSPTEMRSLGKNSRRRINSIEESLTPKSSSRLTSGPVTSPAKGSPLAAPRKSFGNAQSLSMCTKTKSTPLKATSEGATHTLYHKHICPPLLDETMSVQTCKEIVRKLQDTMQKAVGFYCKLQSTSELSEPQVQMKCILQEAFTGIQQDLDVVCPQNPCSASQTSCKPPEDSPSRQLRDERAMALLEKYSEMLLSRMAEKKTD
uniref:WD repeat domain 62 n=1 Tax=Astyanax mexicanus TaxID=7994 RepID=A0A8B9GPB9_ASTMX